MLMFLKLTLWILFVLAQFVVAGVLASIFSGSLESHRLSRKRGHLSPDPRRPVSNDPVLSRASETDWALDEARAGELPWL